MESLNLSKWPEIPVPHISKVTLEVLKRLVRAAAGIFLSRAEPPLTVIFLFVCTLQKSMDEGGNFYVPVAEAFPNIGEAYLAMISNPMDFRTIEEERLNVYQSIRELQEDLILVFSNCMEFNVPRSDLHAIARSLLESIEDTFLGACDELDVRPLHHRSRR